MKKTVAAIIVGLLLVAGCAKDQAGPPAGEGLQTPSKAEGASKKANDTDKASAGSVAKQGVTAWAQPKKPEADWTKEMKEILHPDNKVTYKDMVAFGATKVAGDAVVEEGASVYQATAVVPTDKGKVKVLLQRESGFDSWLVSQINKA